MDRTTEGHEAEPGEVEAVLHNLCGYHLAERDPLFRYTVLTREQVLYAALVAAIKRERGRALAELASGRTLTQVADMAKLGTRQRVARLIALAKAAEAAAAEAQAASLAFEEQLASSEKAIHGGVGGEVVGVADVSSVDSLTTADQVPIVPGSAQAASVFAAEPDGISPGDGDVAGESVAEDSKKPLDQGALLEPTLMMPTLTAVLHPTKEMPSPEDDELAWWRHRDTGAA